MALLVKVDGSKQELDVPKEDRLNFLQKQVGGYIEILPMRSERFTAIVINEEGKLQNLPRNQTATELMQGMLFQGDFIVGDALLCEAHELEDEREFEVTFTVTGQITKVIKALNESEAQSKAYDMWEQGEVSVSSLDDIDTDIELDEVDVTEY